MGTTPVSSTATPTPEPSAFSRAWRRLIVSRHTVFTG